MDSLANNWLHFLQFALHPLTLVFLLLSFLLWHVLLRKKDAPLAPIGKKWHAFLSAILDPWVFFLAISVGLLFLLSTRVTAGVSSTVIFVMLTLSSSVLGGRISSLWASITETGLLEARGRSAVRSLKLLLRHISELENRIKLFVQAKDGMQNPEVTKRNYEEAINICNLLQEQTVSSIENWTDIIDEADIKTQIGLISDLKNQIQEKKQENAQFQKQSEEMADISQQARDEYSKKVSAMQKQIRDLEAKLFREQLKVGGIGDWAAYSAASPLSAGIASIFAPRKEPQASTEILFASSSDTRDGLSLKRPASSDAPAQGKPEK